MCNASLFLIFFSQLSTVFVCVLNGVEAKWNSDNLVATLQEKYYAAVADGNAREFCVSWSHSEGGEWAALSVVCSNHLVVGWGLLTCKISGRTECGCCQ